MSLGSTNKYARYTEIERPQAEDAKYLGLYLDHSLLQTGESIYSPSENNLEFNRATCTGCLAASRSYQSKINCCLTKQTNMDLRYPTLGHNLPFKHRNNSKISNQISQNHRQRTLVRQ